MDLNLIKYKVPTLSEIKASLETNKPKFQVISLFAGGGGSSTGYRMAGGKVLAISEFVEEAQKTYHINWPDTKIYTQDIRNLSGETLLSDLNIEKGSLDILDGSPPCSAFSVCGKGSKLWGKEKAYSDTKQKSVENLFFEYSRILESLMPKVFIAENVKGLAIGKSRGFCNEFFREFDRIGYKVRAKILDAAYLGVPQYRKRLIFIGVRKDLWKDNFASNLFPKPFSNLIPLKVAFEGIENTKDDLAESDCSKYAIYKRLLKLKAGQSDARYFNLVKLSPDSPSSTLTATSGCLSAASICHWDNRKLTIKEAKRITSLPDDYILTGTYSQKIERMGRMVPPLMSKAIAENIYTNILSKI